MILLDTHVAVWLASNHSLLRPAELAVILDPDNEIAVSAVSIWEIGIKWSKRYRSGETKGPIDPREMLRALRETNVVVLPLSAEHASAELRAPLGHGDPFDALLLTIAQELNGRLLTRDDDLRGHPLALHAG